MTGDRSTSTQLKEVWGDDTLYSESFCSPEDVLYEGSEDEDYEDPAARRRRYEEAGQRFLDGAVPMLISAALRGPFDRRSGFINPWISNRHKGIAGGVTRASRPSEKPTFQNKNSTRKPKPDPTLQARYADCHLPSPESLKQAPYTQQHPYLEADELDKVNKWREQVDPRSKNVNGFWVPDDAEVSTSIRKRRATGSEWLKKVSAKRQRSTNTQKRPHAQEQQDDELDELMADMPSSFESVVPVMSPSKRRSPRNAMRKTSGKALRESDDELSPNKAAAATLSSPVSLRNGPATSSPLKRNMPPNYITSSAATQTTPSRLRRVNHMNTPTKHRSTSPEEQPDKNHKIKLQAASEQGIEAIMDNRSETSSITESDPGMMSSEDDNASSRRVEGSCTVVKTTYEDATFDATNGQPERQRCESEPPPSKIIDETDGDSQVPVQKAELDVKMHHLPQVELEPRSVAECAVGDSIQASTRPDNNSNPDDPPVKKLDIPVAQSPGDEIMKMEWVGEGVARQGGADLKLKDNLSDMALEDDSRNSSAATEPKFLLGGNEPNYSQDTNHASTSVDIAADDGKIASVESKSPSMSTMDDVVQSESEPGKFETPATPRRTEHTKDTSEFSFRTIFNRFVPSSPWNKLTQLALSPSSSCPETCSKKLAVTNKSADQIKEVDAQPSQTHKEDVSNPCHDKLISDPDQVHEPLQQRQNASRSQGDSSLKDSETDEHRVPESQQSPWVNTEPAILSRSPLGILSSNLLGAKAFSYGGENTATVSTPDIQSPWAQKASPDAVLLDLSLRPNDENVEQTPFTKPSTPGPRTPEPQFCVKSFSSFMSPSPDENQLIPLSASRSLFRSIQGSLPSSLKSRCSQRRQGLRVSWAASLVEFEGAPWPKDACASRHTAKRKSSPPPETPMGDMQRAHDTRFAKHFEAVAKRNDGQLQNLTPTESQQLRSPGPFAMAETFMAADMTHPDHVSKDVDIAEHAETLACSRASEEPMDVVEDMVREMGDFWDPWNIDAELEQARKAGSGRTGSMLEI